MKASKVNKGGRRVVGEEVEGKGEKIPTYSV